MYFLAATVKCHIYLFICLFIHIILFFFCILIGTSNAARTFGSSLSLSIISLLPLCRELLLVNNSDYIFRRCVLHCKSLFYYLMFIYVFI